ncbi:MAG TPA: ELWxxDGT repeat protein, partial [Flavisolibacter sp.]
MSQTPVKLFSFPSQPTWSPGNTVSKISSFQTGLVYVQGTELLYSDGTQAGTKVLRDFGAEANSITNFYELASTLYFTSQYGTSLVLWQTDGTDAGTTPLDTLSNGTSSTYINGFTSLGSTLYFTASANEQGAELWKYNGTECELVADINPGTPSGVNGIPVAFNNKLYFSGSNTTHGYELWQSDGTTAGTILLKDIHTTASSSPGNFTVFNTKLYFSANGASGIELYSTDGTAAGTVLLKDISAGTPSSSPRSFVIYNSALHFAAYDGTDFAIWKTTGTSAGTTKVVQLAARASGYSTSEFKLCNGSLYFLLSWNYSYSCGFNRTCNSNGKSFKQLAGSTLNTVSGSYPGSFDLSKTVVLNNKLYYVENASSCWYSSCTYYDYLMEFSGTTGTVLLSFSRSQYNGTNAINTKPVVAGGTLFFGASNTVSGGELWTLNTAVSEATVAFERFTGDMVTSVPNTGELKKLGTKLFTLAARQPGINPHQLWQYDMLAKTSVLVFDIGAGNSISNLTLINNKF